MTSIPMPDTGVPIYRNGYRVESILKTWSDTFGMIPKYAIERFGVDWRARCPWCPNDGFPSLFLFPVNDTFYCSNCGESGESPHIDSSFTHEGAKPSIIKNQP